MVKVITPLRLLLLGIVLLALGSFVPDPLGEAIKRASILPIMAAVYYDLRSRTKKDK